MAKFSRIEVAKKMAKVPLVPVFYSPDIETAKSVLQACYEGGIRVMEFMNRGDFAHEVFADFSQAKELGAEVVKIFPGSSVGGLGFVKAVKGPCPWISIMPTGGVAPTETRSN